MTLAGWTENSPGLTTVKMINPGLFKVIHRPEFWLLSNPGRLSSAYTKKDCTMSMMRMGLMDSPELSASVGPLGRRSLKLAKLAEDLG